MMNDKILFNLSYGLFAVLAKKDVKPNACIVNTVFQISSEGPIVALGLNKNNFTHDLITKEKKFSIAILEEQTDRDLIANFGFSSGRNRDKFENLSYLQINDYFALDIKTAGHLFLEVLQEVDCKTHTLFISKVCDTLDATCENLPLTYKKYRDTKFKKSTDDISYICQVCSYEYKGDITKESDDFICPICQKDKTNFKKV